MESTYLKLKSTPNWYVLGHSKEIRNGGVHGFKIFGMNLVAFRDESGRVVVMPDSCPHRNAPLSGGRIENGHIVCPYHGWKFDSDGQCVDIPGLIKQTCFKTPLRPLPSQEHREVVYVKISHEDLFDPHIPAHLSSPKHKTSYYSIDIDCNFIDLAENFLDPFHTAILHPGLIRTHKKRSINHITFEQIKDGFEFHFTREKKQSGAFSFLGPTIIKSIGRFLLPSIVELEYFSHKGLEFTNTMFLTPMEEHKTRAHFYVSIIDRFPYPLFFNTVGAQILRKVVRQDKKMLETQAKNIQLFGGKKFIYAQTDFARRNMEKLIENREAIVSFSPQEVLL